MQLFSRASQPERLISLLGHNPRREFSVLSTLETQKAYLWDIWGRTAVKSVNAVLMQGDESYSNPVCYLCCCSASRMEWSPYNSNCSSASVFSCQCRAPSPNSRRCNWLSDAGILQREQKEQSQWRPLCSTVLPSQLPFWSSNSFKRAGEKKQIPSSVLIFTYRAVSMQRNLTEGGNSISLVPEVSKWSKMAAPLTLTLLKEGCSHKPWGGLAGAKRQRSIHL